MRVIWTQAARRMAKHQLELLVLIGLSVTPSPAQAGLDEVLAEWLVDPKIETQSDLTTAHYRATSSVPGDALAIAPANPSDWTPITKAIPGVLIKGTLKDDNQGRLLLRLPKEWKGKLVVGGASGTRSEFNGDLVISDFVLQKGYAYASQNKGTMNFKVADNSDPNACPLGPVADCVAGFATCPLVDNGNSLAEWGERMNQAALVAKDLIEEHYGSKVSRTYAMGVSNGGYQVRRAIEDNPETFDGGVEWEAVLWRPEGPNFIGELPVGLKKFPAYFDSRLDPNSAEALAIQAANFPPDLVENGTSLWNLNRTQAWEVTECLYIRKLDPNYSRQFPGFAAFANYDYRTRPGSVRKTIQTFANTGIVRKPLIGVHGTLDALITLKGHARPYKAMVEARGFSRNYRLYEIQNGNHLDSLKGATVGKQLPNLELIQPHAHQAFELLEAWVERGITPPPSQCVQRRGTIVDRPQATECEHLLVSNGLNRSR
jgi:Tannase and feruloyl esterase/3HB-oligomer hydrolase (3HBOH)